MLREFTIRTPSALGLAGAGSLDVLVAGVDGAVEGWRVKDNGAMPLGSGRATVLVGVTIGAELVLLVIRQNPELRVRF